MVLILCGLVCLGLLVLGFLAPGLSRRVQKRIDHRAGRTEQRASDAPAPVTGVVKKTAGTSQKAMDKSLNAGRSGREKLD